jgi:RNA polymerase sigma-70 factor (ECF subfamily)
VRKLGGLEEPALFRAWCFRITSRLAFRHLKRRRAWQARHEDDSQLDERPMPEAPPSGETLRRLLSSGAISPASRAVLMLHYDEEIPLPEVAAILEIPLGTAKSRLAYGLKTIRQSLQASGGSHD